MTRREVALLLCLLVGAGLVVAGVSLWSAPAAFVVAGVLVAAIGFLTFTEVG